MTFLDHYTNNGIKSTGFDSFMGAYTSLPAKLREHLILNSDVSAMISVRDIGITRSIKLKILPIIAPRSSETPDKTKRVVGSLENLISRPSVIQVNQDDLLGNFFTLMSTSDLGSLGNTANKGSTPITNAHLVGTIYDGKSDIHLVSLPRSLPFPFDSSLDDTTFIPSTFDKFALVYPFYKPWFTSIDFATTHKALITTLSKEDTYRPTGLSALTADQPIELVPIQLELNDAANDDQIQSLLERFERFENPPIPVAPLPAAVNFQMAAPTAAQPPYVQYVPSTDNDMSQEDISHAAINNKAFFIHAVFDKETMDIDRSQGLTNYTPTSAMTNILKLKKKSRQGPSMLRALRTVHNDLAEGRDVLSCDAKMPSGDAMLNQNLAIAEWSTDPEVDLTTTPLKGLILLNLAAEPTKISGEVLEGRKREALRQKEIQIGMNEEFRTKASTELLTGGRMNSMFDIINIINQFNLITSCIVEDTHNDIAGTPQPVIQFIFHAMFFILRKEGTKIWMEAQKELQPHFPFVIYQVLSSCIRLMVDFQQHLTTVSALEHDKLGDLRIGMIIRAVNIYKRFSTQLELKIDSGSPWTEVPQITPAHKNPNLIWRKQLLDATSNDSKRSNQPASENRDVKRK